MRLVLAFFLASLAASASSEESYQTYVQVNPSTEAGKLFVLTMLSPISGNDEDDRAIEHFTIEVGETQEKIFKNRFYESRDYIFRVAVEENEFDRFGVLVDFIVMDDGVSIYESKQIISAWTFNKPMQQDASSAGASD